MSLLGIGGTGKTRLATRFAWTWLGDFPGGVWFCDLSSARNADGIVQAVAQASGRAAEAWTILCCNWDTPSPGAGAAW